MTRRSLKKYYFDTNSKNIVPPTIFFCCFLTALDKKLINFSIHNRSLRFLQKSIFRPFSSKILSFYILTRCQKKRPAVNNLVTSVLWIHWCEPNCKSWTCLEMYWLSLEHLTVVWSHFLVKLRVIIPIYSKMAYALSVKQAGFIRFFHVTTPLHFTLFSTTMH